MTNRQESLVHALVAQREAEERFVAASSEAERSATGTFESWSLRDHVAHLAHWRRSLAGLLAERRTGGPGVDDHDFDEPNAQVHAAWRDRSWDEAYAEWVASFDVFLDEVRRWDDAALDAAWSPEGPVHGRISGNSIWHANEHLSTWLRSAGRSAEVAERMQGTVARLMSVDDSERAQGTAHYNTACYDALDGRRAAALANLAVAFEKRPDLLGWATEDSDLASLHDDPDFRALLTPH